MDLHPGQVSFPHSLKPTELDPVRHAFHENKDWYLDLIERSHDLLCLHDLQGRLLSVNPASAKALGYDPQEILTIPMRELISPEYRHQLDDYLHRIESEGEAHGLLAVITRSGEQRIWEYSNTLRRQGNAQPVVSGIARDVTEQKRAEKLAREAGELNRQIIASATEGIIVYDRELRCVVWNPFMERMTAIAASSAIGKSFRDLIPPEVRGHNPEIELKKALLGQTITVPDEGVITKAGQRWLSSRKGPLRNAEGEITGVIVTLQDISERKRAEDRLLASEGRYRALYEGSPVGVCWVQTSTGRFLGVNPKFCEIAARTEEDMLGRDFQSITYPDDLPESMASLARLREGRVRNYGLEKRYIRPDGSVRWAQVEIVAMWPAGEKPDWHMAIMQDITERKAAETRFRGLLEAAPDAMVVTDQDGQIVLINSQTEKLFGYQSKELLHQKVEILVPPRFRERHCEHRAAFAAAHRVRGMGIGLGFYAVRKDGTEFPVEISLSPLETEQGMLVSTAIRDVTDRKRADEKLRDSEKRERARATELQTILDTLPIPVLIARDPQCLRIDANRAGAKYLGVPEGINVSLSAMTGRKAPFHFERNGAVIPPEQLLLQRTVETKLPVQDIPTKLVLEDGTVRFELGNAAPLLDEDGNVRGAVAAAVDITEQIQAEQALRQSEERFRVALSGSPIKVFNQDRDLRYTWVYNAQDDWGESDYLGKTDEEIFGPEIGARMSALKRPVLETGHGSRQEFSLTARGKTYYCDLTIEPLINSSGQITGVNCACVDITHVRQITEELRLAKEKLAEEKLYLEESIDTELGFGEIVGRSSAIKQVMQKVAKVAPSGATVLLLGETGTGKELVARALHHRSKREGKSFIKVNCAAIPSGLLESELFGHEKGAFTGAVGRKLGRLELADGGTLFLDEIGEIPLSLQPKLLRALQDMEFERLGGTQTLKVNVRLVAATNRDLLKATKANEFRSDLYYRLNVFPILIPPLRERREDIRPLVEHFVRKFAVKMKKGITSIPSKTMELLVRWEWPGNIRELENFVERSVILTSGSVLQAPLAELENKIEMDSGLASQEKDRERIVRVLRECHGKLGGADGAAARLGLKRTTLQSKLDHLGIKPRMYRT